MRYWLRSRKGYVVALQWLLVGVVAVWGAITGASRTSPAIFWTLIVLSSLVVVGLMRMPLSAFYQPAYWTYLFMTDTVFVGAAIYCMAGFEVDLYLPYFMILLVAGLTTSMARSILVALMISAIYSALMWREGGGAKVLEASFLIRLPFFTVVALFTSYLAQGSRLHQEAVQAARTLQEQVRLLQQLAAGIAHEVRNPLTAMNNSLQMLESRLSKRGDSRELLADALGQIKRMEHLVQVTLELSRPANIQTKWISVNETLRRALEDVTPSVGTGHVDVTMRLTPEPSFVWGDEFLLRQMFSNIIRNAFESMPKGGTVALDTAVGLVRGRERVTVSIRDTGGGIPQHQASRLFQPFYTTKAKGTGLGLSLARKYAYAHGGDLNIEIEQGVGTTVRIDLPVPGPASEARPTEHVEMHAQTPAAD